MKALTVKRQYAEAIASGAKRVEYRSWPTSHRGDLLITVAKVGGRELAGMAICMIRVTDCIKLADGGYAWTLSDPRQIRPFAVRGRLRIFEAADSHRILQ